MRQMILAVALLATGPAQAQSALFTKEILVPFDAQRAPPPVDPRTMEAQLDALVLQSSNAQRALAGLPPLSHDPALAASAARYSRLMRDRNFFDHISPDGETLNQRLPEQQSWRYDRIGENLWSAQGALDWRAQGLADEAAANWIESPTHRDNLLNTEYTLGGVGTAIRGDRVWITMLYGREYSDQEQAVLLRDYGEAPADLPGLSAGMQESLADTVNRERLALGHAAFRDDPALSRIAHAHATAMLATGSMASDGVLRQALNADPHIREIALGIWYGSGGLAWQPQAITAQVIETWRQRPQNWSDAMNPRFNRSGLGIATDGRQVYVAAIFAESRGIQTPAIGPVITVQ